MAKSKFSSIHNLFNNRMVKVLLPKLKAVSGLAGITFLMAGLYFAFLASPPDYQQGNSVRIMYVHVPSAWMAMLCYSVIFCSSISFLVWRNPNADLLAEVTAKIGAAFTLITLITGSLWGKPMWGTYWVWDARLTSVLILFFLYLGLMALRNAHENSDQGKRFAAILAIVGFVNLPIIKFSVDWWNTLHQPASVIRAGGPKIATEMLIPLLLMFGAALCYYIFTAAIMIETKKAKRKQRRKNQRK